MRAGNLIGIYQNLLKGEGSGRNYLRQAGLRTINGGIMWGLIGPFDLKLPRPLG